MRDNMLKTILEELNEKGSQKFKLNEKVIYQEPKTDPTLCVVANYDRKSDTYELQGLADGFEYYDCNPLYIKKV